MEEQLLLVALVLLDYCQLFASWSIIGVVHRVQVAATKDDEIEAVVIKTPKTPKIPKTQSPLVFSHCMIHGNIAAPSPPLAAHCQECYYILSFWQNRKDFQWQNTEETYSVRNILTTRADKKNKKKIIIMLHFCYSIKNIICIILYTVHKISHNNLN